MTQTANFDTSRRTRPYRKLMLSCASAALAVVAAHPQKASAQAFQGTIGSSTGGVVRTPTTGTTETITVGSSTATINWTATGQPSGGSVNFLPSGSTATFTSAEGVTDYTVLNRISAGGSPISLNGHVISTLQGTSTTGGKVWFSTPGGIVVGATAVFDVGGLLLTSADVTNLSTNPSGFSASFSATNPGSAVTIADGAQINALQRNSYVALVAPRVEQNGTVRVNGSAAYVGAQAVTMTMNQGLFDIAVDAGTDDYNGVVHTGRTTGPANETPADHHSIYMVAVPKNQAMTMLLSGDVGFDATTASVKNGQIILSSGNFGPQPAEGEPNGLGSISFSGGNFSSSVTGKATGWIDADGGGWTLRFGGDLNLIAGPAIRVLAGDGETITINGAAKLVAGNEIIVAADGGSISADSLVARTVGSDFDGYVLLEAASGWEGNPGSLSFGSTLIKGDGPDGINGTIAVVTDSGSTISLGQADLRASGTGSIFLAAGSCDCGGEGEQFSLQAASLGEGGGISADSLFLIASEDIDVFVAGGADIDISGTMQGYAAQTAWLHSDGSSSVLRANVIGLNAMTILDDAPVIADIVRFSAKRDLTVGDLNAGDLIALDAGGDILGRDLKAMHSLRVAALGAVQLGDLSSESVNAVALTGDLVAGDVHAGNAIITAVGYTTLGDVTATDTAFLTSGINLVAGDLDATNSLDVHVAGAADLNSVSSKLMRITGSELNIARITGVDVTMWSQGDLNLGDITATGAVRLNAKGDIHVGDVDPTTVQMDAGGDLFVQDVEASDSASFTAGGLASFFGTVSAPTITVTSGDINVADGASLGVSGVTKMLTLNAVSDRPIILGEGGNPSEGQYVLSEDGDIHSEAVELHAKGRGDSAAPDILVYGADLQGSAGDGGELKSITLQTDGSVSILGDVRFIDAASTDKISIQAGGKIIVDTDTGSIVMTDSAGHLSGTLDLQAGDIWVGDGALLDQLAGDPNFSGRDTALATHSGADNPDGYLRAGTITASVADSFFIQNSGTADLFAGIDTGDGGLSLTSTGTLPATVIAYGRQTLSTGQVITNEDFLGGVQLSGTAGFTTDSEVNGCAIGGGSCDKLAFSFDYSQVVGGVSGDDNDSDDDQSDADSEDASSADPSLKLINTAPVNLDHQIDDPVTSGGDVVVGGGGPN
ncbi:hypothetical protein [Sphingomonas limnosediminicola]